MSDRYKDTFPPEVWAAANFDEVNPIGNPVVPGIRMIEAWRKAWTREGREDERERIIALLNNDGRFVGARRLLIELIEATDDSR
jgi:hypothetical protein